MLPWFYEKKIFVSNVALSFLNFGTNVKNNFSFQI